MFHSFSWEVFNYGGRTVSATPPSILTYRRRISQFGNSTELQDGTFKHTVESLGHLRSNFHTCLRIKNTMVEAQAASWTIGRPFESLLCLMWLALPPLHYNLGRHQVLVRIILILGLISIGVVQKWNSVF